MINHERLGQTGAVKHSKSTNSKNILISCNNSVVKVTYSLRLMIKKTNEGDDHDLDLHLSLLLIWSTKCLI